MAYRYVTDRRAKGFFEGEREKTRAERRIRKNDEIIFGAQVQYKKHRLFLCFSRGLGSKLWLNSSFLAYGLMLFHC